MFSLENSTIERVSKEIFFAFTHMLKNKINISVIKTMNKHFLNFISFISCCLQLILFRSYKYLIIEFNIKDLEVYTFNLICYNKQDEIGKSILNSCICISQSYWKQT